MLSYRFCVTLEGMDAKEATCRAWVDTDEGDLNAEMEVPLKSGHGQWRGDFKLRGPDAIAYYRIGLAAPPGAWWSFAIYDSSNQIVMRDSDQVTQQKTWLFGSWQPSHAAQSGAAAKANSCLSASSRSRLAASQCLTTILTKSAICAPRFLRFSPPPANR
jgi:hypothetical protein